MGQYGNCQFCGAEKVLNPKTGKQFCKEKCWLKKEQSTPAPTPTYQPIKEDVNWDKISYGKCKHGFLIEAYKKWDRNSAWTLDMLETEAEAFAEMSMRKLNKPEVKNYGAGDEADQVPY